MRYLFLLPLLLIIIVIMPASPVAAQAGGCMNHDQTLVIQSADTIPVFTSFETSQNCIYEITASGQYIDTDKAADAFYSADPGCVAEKYAANGATRCVHFDFGQSTHGWTPQPWGTSYATWSPGIGWEAAMGLQSIIPVNGMLIVSPPPLLGSMRLVAFESISVYKPGKWNTGGTPAVHLNLPFAWWPTSSPMTNLAYAAPSPSSVAVPALQWTARVGSATGGLTPPGEASLTSLTVWWAGTSNGWEADTWSASDNLDSNAVGSRPAYNAEHEYSWQMPGTGSAFDFLINDRNGDREDNTGELTIRVRAISEVPPRVFRRPLEYSDVNSTFDWFDSSGQRTLTHCVAAKAVIEGQHATSPVPVAFYKYQSSTGPAGITCSAPGQGLSPAINRIAVGATANVAYQTSIAAFSPVHAIEGRVVERRKITATDCFDMTIAETDAVEGPAEPYPPTDLPSTCIFEIPSWANPLDDRSMFLRTQTDNIYLLRVRFEYGEMRYLVVNPRVAQGQYIRDGCVIGETIPVVGWYDPVTKSRWFNRLIEALDTNNWIDLGEYSFIRQAASRRTLDAPQGIVLMGYVSSYVETPTPDYLYGPYSRMALEDYSSPASPCDVSANFANCESINPQFFNEGEYWLTAAGSPVWSNPGVILEPGAKIYLPNLPLDGAVYGGSVQVEQLVFNPLSGGRIRVGIGQSSYILTTTRPRGTETLTIEPISHTPNNGILYDVSVENVGSSDIKVHYLCITEGDAQVTKACLFDNYSFDLGLSGWDTGGASVSGLPGSIGLEHGEWIKQAITLNPGTDGPHTYEVEIDVLVSNAGGQISMQWGGDGAGGGFVAPGIGSTTRTFTGTLTVSSGATQEFQITAYVPDQTGPSTSGAVTINRVCVNGPYPGQGGGGVDLGIPEGCGEVAFPAGGDVQTVLQWHWYQFDQFHRCTFMPKLHELYKSVERGFNDLAMQFKFWRQVMYSFVAWLDAQFFPWLAGYMANITPGTVIVEGGGGCHDVFCLLLAIVESIIRPVIDTILGLINMAAELFFGVLTQLIILFINMLSAVLAWALTALNMFMVQVQAFINAEPKQLPGVPNCTTNPQAGICVLWYIADNTIFAGPGAAIIPLLSAVLWILYAIWLIKEIKALIVKAGASL